MTTRVAPNTARQSSMTAANAGQFAAFGAKMPIRRWPFEPRDVERQRYAVHTRQNSVASDPGPAATALARPPRLRDRQVEIQRRREGRRIRMRARRCSESSARPPRRRTPTSSGFESLDTRQRASGEYVRRRALRAHIPGRGGSGPAHDEEPVPALQPADDAERPAHIAKDRRRQQHREAGHETSHPHPRTESRSDSFGDSQPHTRSIWERAFACLATPSTATPRAAA